MPTVTLGCGLMTCIFNTGKEMGIVWFGAGFLTSLGFIFLLCRREIIPINRVN